MSFKGLNFSKLANGLIFYDLKGINSRVIYMYITILVKTVYLFISQVSGERLQDHWSSGFHEICQVSFYYKVNKNPLTTPPPQKKNPGLSPLDSKLMKWFG